MSILSDTQYHSLVSSINEHVTDKNFRRIFLYNAWKWAGLPKGTSKDDLLRSWLDEPDNIERRALWQWAVYNYVFKKRGAAIPPRIL